MHPKKTAAAILAAGLLAGGGVALVVPMGAQAADSSTAPSTAPSAGTATDRAADRLTAIKDALKGLVSKGTINQSQADAVASTLADADLGGPGGRGGPGGPGHGPLGGRVSPEATAKVIGITAEQLRTAQEAGQTLAQIAQAHDVSKADLISGLVAAAKTQLAADVKAGTITQAQADEVSSDLTARITEHVDHAGPGPGGPGGHGGPGGPGAGEQGTTPDGGTPGTPPAAPSPSSTSST